MRLLNRSLTVLIFAIAVALALGWVARTDWAASRDVLGAGEGFGTAIQPLVKITAVLLITISGVQLVRDGYRRIRNRISPGHPAAGSVIATTSAGRRLVASEVLPNDQRIR